MFIGSRAVSSSNTSSVFVESGFESSLPLRGRLLFALLARVTEVSSKGMGSKTGAPSSLAGLLRDPVDGPASCEVMMDGGSSSGGGELARGCTMLNRADDLDVRFRDLDDRARRERTPLGPDRRRLVGKGSMRSDAVCKLTTYSLSSLARFFRPWSSDTPAVVVTIGVGTLCVAYVDPGSLVGMKEGSGRLARSPGLLFIGSRMKVRGGGAGRISVANEKSDPST